VGRHVRFTPKGLLVILRHLRISLRKSSGVGCVKDVNYCRVSSQADKKRDCVFDEEDWGEVDDRE
jgi:hypothetical protein